MAGDKPHTPGAVAENAGAGGTSAALAAEEKSASARYEVGLDPVVGFYKSSAPEGASSATVASSVLGAKYRVSPALAVGVRLPLAFASISDNADDGSKFALGNIALFVEAEREVSEHGSVVVGLTAGLPTAMGDRYATDGSTTQRRFEVNEFAQQSRGFAEDELFTTHRFGLVPEIAFRYLTRNVELSAGAKFPFLIKVGGAHLPRRKPRATSSSRLAGGRGHSGRARLL